MKFTSSEKVDWKCNGIFVLKKTKKNKIDAKYL